MLLPLAPKIIFIRGWRYLAQHWSMGLRCVLTAVECILLVMDRVLQAAATVPSMAPIPQPIQPVLWGTSMKATGWTDLADFVMLGKIETM